MNKRFAIVTGASSGIGYELAMLCAKDGFDLLIAADMPEIHAVAKRRDQHHISRAIEGDQVAHRDRLTDVVDR